MSSSKTMVRVKLLIYLLLVSGAANAGVTLFAQDPKADMGFKEWIVGEADHQIRDVPSGWDRCVAHARGSEPHKSYYGRLTCYTSQGLRVSVSCSAGLLPTFLIGKVEQRNEDTTGLALESPDSSEKPGDIAKDHRALGLRCTYP